MIMDLILIASLVAKNVYLVTTLPKTVQFLTSHTFKISLNKIKIALYYHKLLPVVQINANFALIPQINVYIALSLPKIQDQMRKIIAFVNKDFMKLTKPCAKNVLHSVYRAVILLKTVLCVRAATEIYHLSHHVNAMKNIF